MAVAEPAGRVKAGRQLHIEAMKSWTGRTGGTAVMQEAKVGERTRKLELEDSAGRSDSEACSREESNKCKFTAPEGDGCMRKLSTKTTKRTAK